MLHAPTLKEEECVLRNLPGDWEVPLEASPYAVGDGIFVSAGHQPAQAINLKPLVQKKGGKGKVTGQDAHFRSAAAIRLLTAEHERGWSNISMAWCGAQSKLNK